MRPFAEIEGGRRVKHHGIGPVAGLHIDFACTRNQVAGNRDASAFGRVSVPTNIGVEHQACLALDGGARLDGQVVARQKDHGPLSRGDFDATEHYDVVAVLRSTVGCRVQDIAHGGDVRGKRDRAAGGKMDQSAGFHGRAGVTSKAVELLNRQIAIVDQMRIALGGFALQHSDAGLDRIVDFADIARCRQEGHAARHVRYPDGCRIEDRAVDRRHESRTSRCLLGDSGCGNARSAAVAGRGHSQRHTPDLSRYIQDTRGIGFGGSHHLRDERRCCVDHGNQLGHHGIQRSI